MLGTDLCDWAAHSKKHPFRGHGSKIQKTWLAVKSHCTSCTALGWCCGSLQSPGGRNHHLLRRVIKLLPQPVAVTDSPPHMVTDSPHACACTCGHWESPRSGR